MQRPLLGQRGILVAVCVIHTLVRGFFIFQGTRRGTGMISSSRSVLLNSLFFCSLAVLWAKEACNMIAQGMSWEEIFCKLFGGRLGFFGRESPWKRRRRG